MDARRLSVLIVGIIVLILGIVFALQGANVIGGSSLMSGNSDYIYIGGLVAVLGLVIIAVSSRLRSGAPVEQPAPSGTT